VVGSYSSAAKDLLVLGRIYQPATILTGWNQSKLNLQNLLLSNTVTMRRSIFLAAAIAVGVEAQCQNSNNVTAPADPLTQFSPGKAVFPCNMGAAIPLGKVPKGCAKFEVIVGQLW
jgi:hypothetical protein